jgi:hypothetical protein
VQEAVRRNTVIGFFDTLYWSRRFRRQIDARKSARLVAVPRFAVPEIFVDAQEDDDDDDGNLRKAVSSTSSPVGSPRSVDLEGISLSSISRPSLHIDTGRAGRASSGNSPSEWAAIGASLSPRRTQDLDTDSHGAHSHVSLSASPSPGGHGRDNSAVSVQDMMQTLGDSAWGESIRRSFTQRRSQPPE